MSRLRARLARLEAAQPPPPEPEPWAHIDEVPSAKLTYALVSMPVPLLEAADALEADPRLPTITAEAARQAPALAAGVEALDAAIDASNRGEALVLPQVAEAIAAARAYLFTNPADFVPAPYGIGHRRHGSGMPPVEYDLDTFEGAVTALVDRWAYVMWNLDRTGANFWSDRHSLAGLKWYVVRHGLDDGDDGDATP